MTLHNTPHISIFETLLQSAAESILVVDEKGRIVWVNARTVELFGYDPGELPGRAVEELIPEGLRKAHESHRTRYAADPGNRPMGSGRILKARRRDGSEFPAEISLTYERNEDTIFIMAIVTDISKRIAMEKALKEAEAAKILPMKERLRDMEAEMATLMRMSLPPKLSATAEAMGIVPLRQWASAHFSEICEEYSRIMTTALERRIVKTEAGISERLSELATRLGFLKAEPRDVVDIHSTVLKKISEKASPSRVRGYVEEGHLLLVEFMGYLTTYYRNKALYVRETRFAARGQGGTNVREL